MSMSVSGLASRSFISGSRLIPPASTFAEPSAAASAASAASRVAGRW